MCVQVVFAPGNSLDVFQTGELENEDDDFDEDSSDHDSDSDDDILSSRARVFNTVSYIYSSYKIIWGGQRGEGGEGRGRGRGGGRGFPTKR